MKYFSKLPIIFYNGQLSKNITTRATILRNSVPSISLYHPYVAEPGERPENTSFLYYGTTDQHWLVSFANKVVDPYYDNSLNDRDFEQYIVKKYGSVANAMQKIIYYKNNWTLEETVLSVVVYESLPANLKKYWNPILGENLKILGYERKQEDTTISTNMIVTVTSTLDKPLSVNEKVVQKNGSVEIASGIVCFSNTSSFSVKHVTGEFISSVSALVTGETSAATGTIDSVDYVRKSVPDEELVYFSPVTAYQHEEELNVQKQNLVLIDRSIVENIENDIANLYPEVQ